MSNHEIGHGLNEVIETIIDLYDENEISISAAKKIICSALDVVNCYDGNEYEALECLIDNDICSCCFEQVDELYDICECSNETIKAYGMKFEEYPEYVSDEMCLPCIKKLLEYKIDDEDLIKKQLDDLENDE